MHKLTEEHRSGSTTRRPWRLVLGAAASVGALMLPAAAAQAAPPPSGSEDCAFNVDSGVLTCGGDVSASITSTGRAAAPTYLLAKFYKNANYGGGVFSVYQSQPCDTNPDTDFLLPSFPSGWNDEISSFRAYSNCTVKLFENVNYNRGTSGTTYGPGRFVPYVGKAFNDEASSATFY